VPAPVDALEAAVLGHLHRTAAAGAVTRDELDLGGLITGDHVAFDAQSQPLRALARLVVQRQLFRPRLRVPAGQQVSGVLEHIGAVARAHQRFGIGSRFAGVIAATAAAVAKVTPTRARSRRRYLHAGIFPFRGAALQAP